MITRIRGTRLMVVFLLVVLAVGCAGCLHISGNTISFGNIEGLVDVSSTPPGAAITVDGTATKYMTPSSMRLASGQHRIVLTKRGYKDSNIAVDVPFNDKITVAGDMMFDQDSFAVAIDQVLEGGLVKFTFTCPDFIDMKKVTYKVTNGDKVTDFVVEGAPFPLTLAMNNYTGSVIVYAVAEDAYGHKATTTATDFTGTKPANQA